MPLSQSLKEYVSACFTGIWIQSHEHDDALQEIAQLCRAEEWQLLCWDIERGLSSASGEQPVGSDSSDPLAAIRAFGAVAGSASSTLLVLRNFHRFLGSIEIVQALDRQLSLGKDRRTFIVILSPLVQVPIELEKQFLVIEHDLPGREQLAAIAHSVATEPGDLPEGADFEAVLDAGAGLTRLEAEGACSLSLARHGRVVPEVLWELKSQMLKKSGLLGLHCGTETFADLGGLSAIKEFCRKALRRQDQPNPLARARGVLLLSPSGCGKSQFAKALGNEMRRPTLMLDIGKLLGGVVGLTEENVRQALRIADAMAPAILFCDELEKALGGAVSGSQGDSGVSARLFGTILTWLNDHTSDVFFIGTCNDVSKLPPEFSRAERFDGTFFLDLPADQEKQTIWELYLGRFGIPSRQQRPVDTGWTGAEIRACCRLSALLDVPLLEAARNIVPVSVTAHETVEQLRGWASGRCLSANKPGIYQRQPDSPERPGRRVSRNPSNN